MPIARVEINGRIARVEVPEGTTPEQAQAIALRMTRQRPPQKQTSFLQGVAEGVLPYAANAARLAGKVIPPLNILDGLTGAPTKITNDAERQGNRVLANSPYQGSTAGRIAGEVLGSLPTMALPGGPAVQGAAAGLLGSRDRSARGLAKNAGIGAVGGYIGNKAIGAASRAISPRVAPAVQRLKDRAIPLTVGQIAGATGSPLGKFVRATENKLTSVPGVGDAISQAHQRGRTAFNKAAFDEGLSSINATAGEVGETGIEVSKQAVRDAYTRALHGVRVVPDDPFKSELAEGLQMGLTPGNYAEDFGRIMGDEVGPVFTQHADGMPGQNIQDALRMMRNYGRQYSKLSTTGANGVPQPSARPVGMAFNDLAGSLESLVNRQAPDVMPAYNAANQAYRNVGVLRDAVSAAKNTGGEFTPAQLGQVARANAKKFGGTHGTTDQPFFDLTRDAQDIMPNTIPNSGTSDRGMLGLLIGGAVGLPAAAASGVASIPYSKAGQEAAEWLLTGRQEPAYRATAEALERLRPFGFLGGAGTALGLFGS